MATLTIYVPDDYSLNDIRKGLRVVAHHLGFRAETGAHSGDGLIWPLLVDIAQGKKGVVPLDEDPEEGLRIAREAAERARHVWEE